eukprot:5694-Heterococcus_DN1.PRE.2
MPLALTPLLLGKHRELRPWIAPLWALSANGVVSWLINHHTTGVEKQHLHCVAIGCACVECATRLTVRGTKQDMIFMPCMHNAATKHEVGKVYFNISCLLTSRLGSGVPGVKAVSKCKKLS